MCISQGRVLERGTHAELLALGGKYAEMWAKQVRIPCSIHIQVYT